MSQLPPPPPPPPPPAAHGRPKRWQVVAAMVAIVAMIGGAVVAFALVSGHVSSPHRQTHAQPAASNGGITTEDQLINAITTQGWTPARAEQLFALDVGPLPGVSVQGITPIGGFDASMAVTGLYGQWDHLTGAQRAAATKYLTASKTQSQSSRAPTAPGADAVLLGSTNTPAFNYQALADAANHDEALKTGTALVELTVKVDYGPPPNPNPPYAATWLFVRYGTGPWEPRPDGCLSLVYNQMFVGLDALSAAAIMAHEVFHCFEYRQEGSGANWETVAPWIQEGGPDWVMDMLDPGAVVEAKAWNLYTNTPGTPYSQRDYDGVGIFGHEGDITGDQTPIWSQLLPIVTAGIGHHDQAALTLLMSSGSNHYYSSWASSYYEDQTHADWHMAGPSTPPTTGPAPDNQTINNGDIKDIASDAAFKAHPITINGSADILVIVLAAGYGQAHDQDYAMEKTLSTSAPLALCQKSGGCKCPDGSPGASEHTILSQGLVSLGLDGGDTGIAAYAVGASLDKFCKQPDQPLPPGSPPPPGGGGGGGGGGSEPEPPSRPAQTAGDPHLLTFDHHWYDLQAVGEFTLVKSTVDDFVVQTRTAPLPGSTTIAVNQAVATRLGGHRLTLTLQNETIIARVDGVVDSHEFFNVGAGTVQRLGTEVGAGYVVEWPDTTTMRVDQMGIAGLNVSIWPAPSRAGQLVGLLGNDNGQASQDFVTASGVNLGATPPAATIHGQFADSWRLSQASSLLDYGAGQSTATFTDRAFPHAFVDASTVPNAAKATQACQGEGITDKGILADCVIDDAAINNQSVLTHYAQAQVVFTVASNLANHLPAFPAPAGGPSPTPTPAANGQGALVDSGAVTTAGADQSFTFPANAGDIIWIGSPGCDNGGLTFALVDPQGRTLYTNNAAQGLLCQGSRFALTTSGSYQLLANADKSRTGRYSVPIRFERHDQVFQTSYGQTISGSIPDAATHDVYVFTAQAGDVVHVFGAGCNVASFGSAQQSSPIYVTLADSAGKSIVGLDCAQNSEYSIQGSATYEIVVNELEHGPGSYQFVIQK